MTTNFYNVLEVPETATFDEIKKSYRKLSMIYHPDKNNNNPESTAKFQKISEAYETLNDPEKRQQYDMSRNNPFSNIRHNMGSMNSVDELFSNLFGMPFGPSQGTPFNPFGQSSNHFGPQVRVFHNGIPVNMNQQKPRPIPIMKNIEITMDKALTGSTIPIDIERWIIENDLKVFENETIYVTIPKGVDSGEIIVLPEKGNVISSDCKGEVKIFVHIKNDTEFKRNGLDLVYEKTITLKEALCGFTFDIKYITGKMYTINNASGHIINDGYKKVIPNLGFARDQHVGNLVIEFRVKFPDKLTNEVLEQLKSINF